MLIFRARTFEWKVINAAVRTRQSNRLDLFNTQRAQYLDELKRKVPKKDRTDFSVAKKTWFKSWKTSDAPKVPAAKKGYKAGTWVITQIAFIGPNGNIQRYRANIMDENEMSEHDYADYDNDYSEYQDNQYAVNGVENGNSNYFAYFVVSAVFNVLLLAVLCCIFGVGVGYGVYHLMKNKDVNKTSDLSSHV